MSRTVAQRTNSDGYPKAGELIEMTGLQELEASQRAISNLLYQNAHDSGRISSPGAVFEIPMATIRAQISKHESGDRLKSSLVALARIVASVTYIEEGQNGKADQHRIVIGGLFEFFDIAQQDMKPGSILRYALNSKLAAVIDRSARWGRIKAEVFCAMRSRYAIALYEALALRRNMDRCLEQLSIERFRELMAVKDNTYKVGTELQKNVIDPAVLEVNGLSDINVDIKVHRKHPRAVINMVTIAWWNKTPLEIEASIKERNRSKIGRLARLRTSVEMPTITLELPN